jgi:hypothetical protein
MFQVCHYLMAGQVKSVKPCLKQLQQSIQTIMQPTWPSDESEYLSHGHRPKCHLSMCLLCHTCCKELLPLGGIHSFSFETNNLFQLSITGKLSLPTMSSLRARVAKILWNLEVFCCIQEGPPVELIRSQLILLSPPISLRSVILSSTVDLRMFSSLRCYEQAFAIYFFFLLCQRIWPSLKPVVTFYSILAFVVRGDYLKAL